MYAYYFMCYSLFLSYFSSPELRIVFCSKRLRYWLQLFIKLYIVLIYLFLLMLPIKSYLVPSY